MTNRWAKVRVLDDEQNTGKLSGVSRLTRMTDKTLEDYIADENAEIRKAAKEAIERKKQSRELIRKDP